MMVPNMFRQRCIGHIRRSGFSSSTSVSAPIKRLMGFDAPQRNVRFTSCLSMRWSPNQWCTPAHARYYSASPPDTIETNNRVIIRDFVPIGRRGVVEVCINNPRKLNSLDSELISELRNALVAVSKQDDLRCVVLRGINDTATNKHPSFCAGANLNEMSELATSQSARDFISRLSDLCTAVRECPVPVIAAIHGFCFGAGLELAASCDVRYATNISKFAMPEVMVGIPSVIQARLLVDIMGWANARHLMLFGKTLGAEEAHKQGLVNEVFTDSSNMDRRIQEDIDALLKCGPKAVRSQKRLINSWENMDVDAGIQAGVDAFAAMWDDGGREPKQYLSKAMEHLRSRKSSK